MFLERSSATSGVMTISSKERTVLGGASLTILLDICLVEACHVIKVEFFFDQSAGYIDG